MSFIHSTFKIHQKINKNAIKSHRLLACYFMGPNKLLCSVVIQSTQPDSLYMVSLQQRTRQLRPIKIVINIEYRQGASTCREMVFDNVNFKSTVETEFDFKSRSRYWSCFQKSRPPGLMLIRFLVEFGLVNKTLSTFTVWLSSNQYLK